MSARDFIKTALPRPIRNRLGIGTSDIHRYFFDKNLDLREDIRQKYGFDGELLELFASIRGPVVHKWHHYIPLYDRYFAPYRGTPLKFLEIGVSEGGSMDMWRKYFGPDAIIYGIDINPECAQFDGRSGQVRIGSQADKKFLDAVVQEMGGVDVILDDGSHHMDHLSVTLEHLFPKLSTGGLYMIEDLHSAYWYMFGGGFNTQANFFKYIGELVDDMHHWYHEGGVSHPSVSDACVAIHIHDSIAVFDKGRVYQPTHSRVG